MFPFDDVIMDINAGFQMYNLLTRIRWFFIQAVNRVNCHYPFPLIKDSHKHYLCDTITWGYHQSLISSDACMSRQTDSRLVRGTVLCLVRWHYLNWLFMVGRTLRKKTAVKYWSKYIFLMKIYLKMSVKYRPFCRCASPAVFFGWVLVYLHFTIVFV